MTQNPTPAPAVPGPASAPDPAPKKRGFLFYAGMSALIAFVAAGLTFGGMVLWYRHAYMFEPTELSPKEEQVLGEKIEALEQPGQFAVIAEVPGATPAEIAEAQSLARRTIIFTERELNGFLNHNSELGERLAFELQRDAIILITNYPFEDDTPFVGGKTLRARLTLATLLEEGGLKLAITDLSVNGVPLPNAWLGGVKGQNLLEEYESEHPVLKALGDGIANFEVQDGQVVITLAE
ncbi:MAG: hypothetical protein R3F11_13440 [Verrucomicrobiales bacterium]